MGNNNSLNNSHDELPEADAAFLKWDIDDIRKCVSQFYGRNGEQILYSCSFSVSNLASLFDGRASETRCSTIHHAFHPSDFGMINALSVMSAIVLRMSLKLSDRIYLLLHVFDLDNKKSIQSDDVILVLYCALFGYVCSRLNDTHPPTLEDVESVSSFIFCYVEKKIKKGTKKQSLKEQEKKLNVSSIIQWFELVFENWESYSGTVTPIQILNKYDLASMAMKSLRYRSSITIGRLGRKKARSQKRIHRQKQMELAKISSFQATRMAVSAAEFAMQKILDVDGSIKEAQRELNAASIAAMTASAKAANIAMKASEPLTQLSALAFRSVKTAIELENRTQSRVKAAIKQAAEVALSASTATQLLPSDATFAADLAAGIQRRSKERIAAAIAFAAANSIAAATFAADLAAGIQRRSKERITAAIAFSAANSIAAANYSTKVTENSGEALLQALHVKHKEMFLKTAMQAKHEAHIALDEHIAPKGKSIEQIDMKTCAISTADFSYDIGLQNEINCQDDDFAKQDALLWAEIHQTTMRANTADISNRKKTQPIKVVQRSLEKQI